MKLWIFFFISVEQVLTGLANVTIVIVNLLKFPDEQKLLKFYGKKSFLTLLFSEVVYKGSNFFPVRSTCQRCK